MMRRPTSKSRDIDKKQKHYDYIQVNELLAKKIGNLFSAQLRNEIQTKKKQTTDDHTYHEQEQQQHQQKQQAVEAGSLCEGEEFSRSC
jgi:hypothetical protein